MNRLQILEEARKVIDTPEKWIKGSYYGTRRYGEYGYNSVLNPNIANCFCALGAIRKVFGDDTLIEAYFDVPFLEQLVEFNDDMRTEHKDVLRFFDEQIEREREAMAKSGNEEQSS